MKKKLKDMVVGDEFTSFGDKHRVHYICKEYIVVKITINFYCWAHLEDEYKMIEPEPEYLYEYILKRHDGSCMVSLNLNTHTELLKIIKGDDFYEYKLLRKFHPVTLEEIKQ